LGSRYNESYFKFHLHLGENSISSFLMTSIFRYQLILENFTQLKWKTYQKLRDTPEPALWNRAFSVSTERVEVFILRYYITILWTPIHNRPIVQIFQRFQKKTLDINEIFTVFRLIWEYFRTIVTKNKVDGKF
jgi:hypothetical protein